MISFREPRIEDRAWVQDRFAVSGCRGSEYSFSNLFLWNQAFRQQIARMDGFVLTRLDGIKGQAYLFPAGDGPLEPALGALEEDAEARGERLRLLCVTQSQLEALERLRPGEYEVAPDRDGWDYLYDIDRMVELKGKKLQAKRNHINRFLDNNPDWLAEEIDEDNLVECAEMDLEWNRSYRPDEQTVGQEERSLLNERHALSRAFAHYRALNLSGLLLRSGGRVVAFTIGSPINGDTFDIHFEKAYSQIQGAYPMIYREFARWLKGHRPGLRWINREDDMGLPGLRKAKLSYVPDQMVEKFTAVRKQR